MLDGNEVTQCDTETMTEDQGKTLGNGERRKPDIFVFSVPRTGDIIIQKKKKKKKSIQVKVVQLRPLTARVPPPQHGAYNSFLRCLRVREPNGIQLGACSFLKLYS
jgi:hypothetical protein